MLADLGDLPPSPLRPLVVAALVAAVVIPGCGAATGQGGASNDDVRTVQRDEARLEEGATSVADAAQPCPTVCHALVTMDEAAEHLCQVARSRRDDDLDARCDAAQRRVDASIAARHGACQCGATP